MRAALLALLLATPAVAETAADRLHLGRGFNTEIWVEWLSVQEILDRPGFLDTYPDYPRHFTRDEIAGMKAAGFDWVRIAAEPSVLLALAGTDREARLLTQLRTRVTEMQAAGLKVMLDLHNIPRPGEDFDTGWALDSDANFAAYVAMAARVAATVNGMDPDRTALSLFNEPVQDCDELEADPPQTGGWPARLVQLHAGARAAAPDLPLVLSGACWGGVLGLQGVDPAIIADDNVLWSFHTYDPFLYSHQNADWTGDILRFIAHLPYPPQALDDETAHRLVAEAALRAARSDAPEAALATPQALARLVEDYRSNPADAAQQPIRQAAAWADSHAIPRQRMVLDEFGAVWIDDQGAEFDLPGHLQYLRDKRELAEAYGFGWAVWSLTGNMRIGRGDTDRRMDLRICPALGLTGC